MTVTIPREPWSVRTTLLLTLALGWCACTSVPNPKCLSDNPAPGCPVADGGADGAVGDGAAAPCGGACGGATPHCNEATNTCVECLATTDCPQAKSVCASDTKTCGSCQNANDCSRFADAKVCGSTGACIQCNAADETACTQGVCDLTTNLCTTIAANSADVCQACVNDKQCDYAGNYRCVPMNFQGNARAGGYCLLVSNGSNCTKPYAITITRGSLSDPTPTTPPTYCGINESKTTCEAVVDRVTIGKTCGENGSPNDALCGAANLSDAKCTVVGVVSNLCTYECATVDECQTGDLCNKVAGAPDGSPTYCGVLPPP